MSAKSSLFITPTTNFIAILIIFISLCSIFHVVLVVATNDTQFTPKTIPINCGCKLPPPPPPPPPPKCTPPPPPPPPPPKCSPPPVESRVQRASKTIQKFLGEIGSNTCNLNNLGKNPDFCKNSKFGCGFLNKYKQQTIYAIQFNECFIKGKNTSTVSIDNFINKIPDVSIFHANSNNFAGEIPVLSNLPYLFELDLSNNKYTGKFPMNVLGASQLIFLDLRFNTFEGPIPSGLFDLQVLALFINNNKFQGELPSNLGSTTAAFLTFANNLFTGPIPRSIGKTANTLLEVLFLNNHLSGCIPYEIGLLKKARVFDVSRNNLTGPIPRSFACLEKMQYLVLANNEFYGNVPEELCKLPLLSKLNLCGNYFTQVGPECMKLIQKGVLIVKDNCISGLPNQKSPEVCKDFFSKPKPCGDYNNLKAIMNYLPCKNTASYLNSEVSMQKVPEEAYAPLTYGALTPDKN